MMYKKIVCAVLCGVLLMTAAACGGNANSDGDVLPAGTEGPTSGFTADAQTTETVPASDWTTAAKDAAEDAAEEAKTTDAAETTEAEETTEGAKEISLAAGLNSTDVAEVMEYYKLAAAKNQNLKFKKTLTLVSLNGGEGKVAGYVETFEPIAKKAIDKNITDDEPLPGDYKALRPEDWQSAEAVSDGTYTTIRVRVKPQTDGPNGKAFDGPVGRSMTVLPGVQTAVDEMVGVSADFDNGDVSLEYQNPEIVVKVDNRTGAFVQGACSWSYRVHTVLRYLEAKVLAFTVHLVNADGNIDYRVSY